VAELSRLLQAGGLFDEAAQTFPKGTWLKSQVSVNL
jgi:hypothetical protein